MKTFKNLLLVVLVLINAGCAKSLSSNIATGEVFAIYKVDSDAAGRVSCHASFTVGGTGGTYIELVGSDKVTCSDGVQEIELKENPAPFNIVTYSATGLMYVPGRTYTVTFSRSSSEVYSSTTQLPLPVSILSPTPNANLVKGSVLPVNWNSASSNGVRLTLSFDSESGSGSKTASDNDDGLYTFSGSDTQPFKAGNVTSTIGVERYLRGNFTSGLKGGSIEGSQQASVGIMLVD